MAKTREQKQETLTKLTESFKQAASVVFVHFKGLTVAQESEMRRTLKNEGISYMVAKKTLIGKALTESGAAGTVPSMEGEVAVAYNMAGEDQTAPARRLYEYGRQFKDRISIVGGVFQGTMRDGVSMQEIATIPPMPVLRGMFVNVINSPIAGLAIAIKAIADKKQ